jgi:hypothetical protein
MDQSLDAHLGHIVERQHGAFTRAIADQVGFTRRQRQRRLEQGRWEEPFEGVYRVAGTPRTWRSDLYCAVLAGNQVTAGSHRSATTIYELPGADRRLREIICPRWRRARSPLLVVHESLALSPEDIRVVDSIPVTTVERTLLDLGAVRSFETVERAVEEALRRELTTLDDLDAILRRLARKGRRGAGVLRRILDARTPHRELTANTIEMRMLQVLRANGLPEPVPQFVVRHQGRFIAQVDAAYVEWRIALEYDSYAWHSNRPARIRDNARRNALINIDWAPISVIWEDLESGGHVLCRQIRDRARSVTRAA